ncbi:GNAT family N-acetyltransferase [Bacillus pseudomycoides]|uniref:N-acetyltransferase n=1 Tax=Bacillus pseudomycoides TaxID=64104 RepID=A0ABD6TB46_9BACI|nr:MULTISPECIES: GNAT family N-acetyltransferase [Bacillus]EEM04060.1 Acetyltransferase, GNAT [Bacillus pseudomycoides]MBD5796304.1 GNAT family N-acetyltransferase [Bacillus pseudomycoides]MBJ8028137.1 GNAT family N-acetyltransferase [Bacillus cereus group sp. N21]MCX2825761.1 GNAT family N-acetyltransferase [Bacillus sp. DHT2]MDR4918123.1 GNAT family N-acetyltransferase [Bacillus pseudomycoides]
MIRLAKESDAESFIAIRKEIILSAATTKFFISSPNKIPDNVNKEREKILKSVEDGNLYIVSEMEGAVVGFLIFNRYKQERLKHVGTMGMGIREECCNQGIGTKLIKFLVNWAKKQKGLEKICLGIVSVNDRAIKVYKRTGFIEEGRQRKQIKYEDGSYGEDTLMAYYLQ